jgi:hypothetical protein
MARLEEPGRGIDPAAGGPTTDIAEPIDRPGPDGGRWDDRNCRRRRRGQALRAGRSVRELTLAGWFGWVH